MQSSNARITRAFASRSGRHLALCLAGLKRPRFGAGALRLCIHSMSAEPRPAGFGRMGKRRRADELSSETFGF
jgi:hypothetical protein